MKNIHVRLIKEGEHASGSIPISIALVDLRDIDQAGVAKELVVEKVAQAVGDPVGINIFDMEAVTTTSDGVVVEGAIVKMAAGDGGKVHKEFGMLAMEEMRVTQQLIAEEPHLQQIEQLYPGRRLYRGPNPETKHVPVHNAVISGRAVNNNSATEMMNVVTMEEILLPILGQLQLMRDQEVLFGPTGHHISVGIGMTVAELYGRVFPSRQFRAGETAHNSGEFSKNLKAHIPCIVAPKRVLAKYILQALRIGMVPGQHLGCSPAVLACAKAVGCPIATDRIAPEARRELASRGMGEAFFSEAAETITDSELLDRADEIIPGASSARLVKANELVTPLSISV